MTSPSPYVTVYHKETGAPMLCYVATLRSFIETGDYSLEAPAGAGKAEVEVKAKMPTAGREASREAILEHHQDANGLPITLPAPEAAPEATAPVKAQPKRRPTEAPEKD